MLDWITGGNIPQFWKNYTALFDSEEKSGAEKRYVVFDLETSGNDAKEDIILSIGALGLAGNALVINDFFEAQIKTDEKHEVNTAKLQLTTEKVVEAEAIIQFIRFAGDAILVSHNSNTDVEMLNQALKRLDLGRIKNSIMDINVLYQKWKDLPDDYHATTDEMCDALKISKGDRHTASGNAYITALLFLKLKKKLGINL
jgi:DNA polymerase-3 subunit epsilon